MQKSLKVLIVSFHYLPEVMAASYRVHAWAKFLPRYSWEPVILTKTSDRQGSPQSSRSVYSLSKEVDREAQCIVYRNCYRQKFKGLWDLRARYTRLGNPSRGNVFFRKLLNFVIGNFFMLPDERYDWFADAVRAGKAILAKQNIQAILSTGAPWTDFLIARHLSLAANIPWIADYRDPWSQRTSLGIHKEYFVRELANRIWEKRLTKTAAALIQISEPLQQDLAQSLNRKVYLIPNGYDPDNFRHADNPGPGRQKFTISFIGTLHNNTDTTAFMAAFERFVESENISSERCEVRFVGDPNGFQRVRQTYPNFASIERFFHFEPAVSQQEATQRMCRSHILLSFPLDMRGCCPAKTYEYLASGRPILVSPDGKYRDVIKKTLGHTNGGVVLNTPAEIKEWLQHKFNEFSNTGTVKSQTNRKAVQIYSRENQVRTLSQILSGAIN